MELEYWFDFSCPYAYLASTQVEALADRTKSLLVPQPMLLGGVFRARDVPQKLFETLGPSKARHSADDIRRLARYLDVPLLWPSGHPLRTVDALRALLVVGPPYMPLAHRFFRAYWVHGIDIGTREGVVKVLDEAGHDARKIMEEAQRDGIKDELRRRTDKAIEIGVFGAPTFVVGGELYFGVDRIDFVERALGGRARADSILPGLEVQPVDPPGNVDFYFDYSSPFSYLASERIDSLVGPVTWKPILLGGLFKQLKQVDVPFFTQSEAKQRHTQADLKRQAAAAGASFVWPSRFPMNTVLPLRATLLAMSSKPRRARDLVRRIFRAYWAEDRDISDAVTISTLADEMGLDGKDLVAATQDPSVKEELRRATEGAAEAGVFGAPTFVVHAKEPRLFWGADRLPMAARAAAGDERLY